MTRGRGQNANTSREDSLEDEGILGQVLGARGIIARGIREENIR